MKDRMDSKIYLILGAIQKNYKSYLTAILETYHTLWYLQENSR